MPDDHEINPLRKFTGLAGRHAGAFSMGWLGMSAGRSAFFLPHKKHE
jgi:hypothetical protein